MRVARLRTSPVKGFAQREVDALALVDGGIAGDRRLVLVGERDRPLYSLDLGTLATARATWDEESALLEVELPGGGRVTGVAEPVGSARRLPTSSGRPVDGRPLGGPFAEALSEIAGRTLRLFQVGVGHGGPGPLTVLGDGSVSRLAEQLGVPTLDPRRFKMNVELSGVEAHGEDAWEGALVRVGEAVLRMGAPVPRCALTTRDPDTQQRDLDTLRALLAYRGPLPTGEPGLGVYATVVAPAVIRVGDPVAHVG